MARRSEHLVRRPDVGKTHYLDGEMSMARIRAIRNHLMNCWKCRSVLADLESQAEAISRRLTANPDSDIDRSVTAKEKFFQWRESFEKRQKSLFRILLSSIIEQCSAGCFTRTEADALFCRPVEMPCCSALVRTDESTRPYSAPNTLKTLFRPSGTMREHRLPSGPSPLTTNSP